jgi:hypothetical protein
MDLQGRKRKGCDFAEHAIEARRIANLAQLDAAVAADGAAIALRRAAVMAARATEAEAMIHHRYDEDGGYSLTSSPSDAIVDDESLSKQ